METDWNELEQSIIGRIMVTETMHDAECRGCRSCDDVSTRESCHRLCNRQEALRRMRRRTVNGAYVVRDADRRIYERELKRWPKSLLATRRIELGLDVAPAA
jgi:hypothetical protein